MKPGDLALMCNVGSSKVHIVRLRDQPYPDERESPSGGPGRADLWSGTALCRCRERYYWWRYEGMVEDSWQCRRCFSKWRGADRPPVVGLSEESGAPAAERPPPTAWREVPATGLPKDSKPEEDERAVRELRRWVRGPRYVRLVRVLGDSTYSYGVNTGIVGDEEKTDRWTTRAGTQAECLQRAWEIMAAGGDPF